MSVITRRKQLEPEISPYNNETLNLSKFISSNFASDIFGLVRIWILLYITKCSKGKLIGE